MWPIATDKNPRTTNHRSWTLASKQKQATTTIDGYIAACDLGKKTKQAATILATIVVVGSVV